MSFKKNVSVGLLVCLSVDMSISLSVSLSVHLSIGMSISLSVILSVHLSDFNGPLVCQLVFRCIFPFTQKTKRPILRLKVDLHFTMFE